MWGRHGPLRTRTVPGWTDHRVLFALVIFVIALLLAIVLMAVRRRAVWVPLLAIALTIGAHILAVVLVDVALRA